MSDTVPVSPKFRQLVVKAVLSIALFIFTYLLLFVLSLGLTVICVWAGYMILTLSISAVTVGTAIGLGFMGGMITYFLLKVIFARHTVDRSHLTEITEEEEPQLFALIREIVQEVQTDFPKKIYLSVDVNAGVFYDSSFWSMFLPVQKNLQIGMGLVNSVTKQELKAILAHEFGHFSQRSMKLGSYVYYVNQVIYNMVYENGAYKEEVGNVANASRFIALFMYIAIGIVQGIQWILQQIYSIVNLNYMGLSREMEFHADAVAANVAGTAPSISSLLRMDLSDQSLATVMNFYDDRYQQSIIPANIYQQHHWMMEYLATNRGLTFEAGLPVVTEAYYDRYNKSKLVIKDQWASHPTTEERIAALHQLNKQKEAGQPIPGNVIFSNAEQRQKELTARIYRDITFPATPVLEEVAAFKAAYQQEYPLYQPPAIFNGYYDRWDPSLLTQDEETIATKTPAVLFGDEMVQTAYSITLLTNDQELLHQLTVVNHQIKTFDYDGVKYTMDDIYPLIKKIEDNIAHQYAILKANDAAIYSYFHQLDPTRWEKLYGIYTDTSKRVEAREKCYTRLVKAIKFMTDHRQITEIEQWMVGVKEPEQDFKAQLSSMLKEVAYQQVLLPDQIALFSEYIANDKPYFQDSAYDETAVELLFRTLQAFPKILETGCRNAKLELLNIGAEMMAAKAVIS